MRLILTEQEIEYIKSNYDNKRIVEIVEHLKPKIKERTNKDYCDKYIQRVISELHLPRKHKVEKTRNQYVSKAIDPVNMSLNFNIVMKTKINGYKPIKRCKNFVLYEKDIRGVKLHTTYTYQDLYKIFKEVEHGQRKIGKLSLDEN